MKRDKKHREKDITESEIGRACARSDSCRVAARTLETDIEKLFSLLFPIRHCSYRAPARIEVDFTYCWLVPSAEIPSPFDLRPP